MMKRYLPAFIILLAYSIALLLIGRCSVPKQSHKQPIIEFSFPETISVPVPAEPAEIIEVMIPVDVDTAAILENHYKKNIYQRPVIDIPNLRVSLTDTIFNNILIGSSATYQDSIPQYKHDISVGFLGGYNTFSMLATYRYERFGISAGYDLINKSVVVGANYRLFRW